ncbi:cytochrome p450 [Rhyzopertha dominica]|nr:cytochrome p450 [Rhyzopertha dominica]
MHILQKARTFVCIIRIRNNHKEVNNLHVSASINLQIKNDIPGPKSLPGIGTLYQYFPVVGLYAFDRLQHNGFKKYTKFGPVVREEIVPGVNIVWLFKPEDIEVMFRCEGKYPMRRSHLALEKYRLDRPNVYNTGGLLPTNGPEWWRLRSVFQRGLSSPAAVQNFLTPSNEVIQEWIEDRLQVLCEKSNVDYLPELSRLFLELTCVAALDLRLNSFSRDELRPSSRSSKLMQAALTTNSCVLKTDNGPQLWRKFETPLYRKLRKAQEYMEDVAIDLLSLKVSLFNDNYKRTSLLQSYLSSPELDFKDIIGVICDFLLAGIDTTTYTTSFILYHLAKNEEAQAILHNESQMLLPNMYSTVTKDILNQAQYAKAVLKESLRLRPVSVGIGRVLQANAKFSGYEVPAGTVVVSQNQVSCRLDQYFPSANEFRPERWLKNHPSYTQPHPFLVIPFGHGPRSCIARRLAEQNMLILILKAIGKEF